VKTSKKAAMRLTSGWPGATCLPKKPGIAASEPSPNMTASLRAAISFVLRNAPIVLVQQVQPASLTSAA
jgi:hypothetical protein